MKIAIDLAFSAVAQADIAISRYRDQYDDRVWYDVHKNLKKIKKKLFKTKNNDDEDSLLILSDHIRAQCKVIWRKIELQSDSESEGSGESADEKTLTVDETESLTVKEDDTVSKFSYASSGSSTEDTLSERFKALFSKVVEIENEEIDHDVLDIAKVIKNDLFNADEADDDNFELCMQKGEIMLKYLDKQYNGEENFLQALKPEDKESGDDKESSRSSDFQTTSSNQ